MYEPLNLRPAICKREMLAVDSRSHADMLRKPSLWSRPSTVIIVNSPHRTKIAIDPSNIGNSKKKFLSYTVASKQGRELEPEI